MAYSKADKLEAMKNDLLHVIAGDPELKKTVSYLVLDSDLLPDVKKWQIGHTYTVKLIVQQIAMSQDDRITATEYDRNKVMAKFEVVKAIEAEED